MTAPVRTDALSLTLPKAKGRALRLRRPKLPGKFWWWLAWFLFSAQAAVRGLLSGKPADGLLILGAAVFYWKSAIRAKEGRGDYPWRVTASVVLAYFAVWAAGSALGVM